MDGGGSEVDGGNSEVDGGGEVRLYHDTEGRCHDWCRQENNLICNLPTEPSLEAQSVP